MKVQLTIELNPGTVEAVTMIAWLLNDAAGKDDSDIYFTNIAASLRFVVETFAGRLEISDDLSRASTDYARLLPVSYLGTKASSDES